MSQPAAAAPPTADDHGFFGHPRGLASLFGVELWERFSFYGMQAILTYYLYYSVTEGGLELSRATATSIVGGYGGAVYMSAVAAAFVADRLIGPEKTLLISACLVMGGHVSLALVPGMAGIAIGLPMIALGSGGIKNSAQVVLGQLYPRGDPRIDSGFSIFYLGVNIGGFFGPLITGWLWGARGFHWGFGAAAVGMAVGLAQYLLTRRTSIAQSGAAVPNPLPRNKYWSWIGATLGIVGVFVALMAVGVIKLENISDVVVVLALAVAVVLWLQMYTSASTSAEEKARLVGFIPMALASVAFFAIFQQQFTVISIYADSRLNRVIDWNLFGWHIDFTFAQSWVQSINPVFIIALSPVFAAMWMRLGRRQWSTPMKFGVALLVIGAALLLFLPFVGGAPNSTPLYALVAILLLFTIGELLLSPVGNAMATKIAPRAFASRMFAVWLMTLSLGTSLAGTLAKHYDPDVPSRERAFFLSLSAVLVVCGLLVLAMRKWISRKFGDVA